MPYRKLALVLGDCLFPHHDALEPTEDTLFFLSEDRGLCTHFQYHKQKIVLFLSAMRSHADAITESWPLEYFQIVEEADLTFEQKLEKTLKAHPTIAEIVTYEIEDRFFDARIRAFCEKRGIQLSIARSPKFISTREDFAAYDEKSRRPFMAKYYEKQRRKLKLLVDEQANPVHGQWSFDEDNRKKLPKGMMIPAQSQHSWTDHTKTVMQQVEELFGHHPGSLEEFNWATTREQALACLERFLEERFGQFGPYEDAIDQQGVFLFHSVLSPYLNMGLLTPQEVLKKALARYEQQDTHFPSVEGFVRQIIGWREFLRGIYHSYHDKLYANFFNHQRKMKSCWYEGTTGILPLDDSICKAQKHGYTHHIERLMVLGNIMLLCELHPDQVYRWFMEMYVDSADWVMAPNVYGMSQFADGGIFATKPYIGGSNYILKMSNYSKKGDWPEIVNGLYWRFIDRHRDLFSKNPRMAMMTKTLDKMDAKKKERLFGLAEVFVERVTF